MNKDNYKLSKLMYPIFYPFDENFLLKAVDIRLRHKKREDRHLEPDELNFFVSGKYFLGENALLRDSFNIPDKFYNLYFGNGQTEYMHLNISKENLKSYDKDTQDAFNNKSGPNLAREYRFVHALQHAFDMFIAEHMSGGPRPDMIKYVADRQNTTRTIKNFFALLGIVDPEDKEPGLSTEELLREKDNIVKAICNPKGDTCPHFTRKDVFKVNWANFDEGISGKGYLEEEGILTDQGGNTLCTGIPSKTINDFINSEIDSVKLKDGFTIFIPEENYSFKRADITGEIITDTTNTTKHRRRKQNKKDISNDTSGTSRKNCGVNRPIFMYSQKENNWGKYRNRRASAEFMLEEWNKSIREENAKITDPKNRKAERTDPTRINKDLAHFLKTNEITDLLKKACDIAGIDPNCIFILDDSEDYNIERRLTLEKISNLGLDLNDIWDKVGGKDTDWTTPEPIKNLIKVWMNESRNSSGNFMETCS